MAYLGFDTSNYTTSVAAYFPDEGRVIQEKLLLPVKSGEKGLRQSDAVFHHTVQLKKVFKKLMDGRNIHVDGVCASAKPCLRDDSYMPCFLVGRTAASCAALSANAPFFETAHQHGHIVAALFSVGRLDLLKEKFVAFHLSGGTTEALLVSPDENEIISAEKIAGTLDLKAGQAVDRVGLMLGLRFPCGKELEKLAFQSEKKFKIKPSMKDLDCSLSGIENKAKKFIEQGEKREDIALFCIESVAAALDEMTKRILEQYGNLPLVYSGGVMSNTIISERFKEKYNAVFAKPEFSCDNAAGVAIIGFLKGKRKTERNL